MIAQALDRLRGVFGVPDRRTPEQLEADLADELAFHLDGLEQESLAEGAAPAAARAEARRRFGDPDRIRAACRRVALEERRMLQRINAVLTVVLLVAVAALGVQAVVAQRANARTLGRLDEMLRTLSLDRPEAAPAAAPSAPTTPVVYLDGDVARPGSYELPRGLTVQRLLAAAGGARSDQARTVKVYRAGARLWNETLRPASQDGEQDLVLKAGDLVVVTEAADDDSASRPPPSDLTRRIEAQTLRLNGPVQRPNAAVTGPGTWTLAEVLTAFGGLALAREHLEAVLVRAVVSRSAGDGTFVIFPAEWLGTHEPPQEPRLIAIDAVELSLEPHAPPRSLPRESLAERSPQTLTATAQLLEAALAKARVLEPSADWPTGTSARLTADLAALGDALAARTRGDAAPQPRAK